MNILIVTQYFWPESFLINSLSTELAQRGHQVTVLTGLPNYPVGKFYPGYGFLKGPWKEKYNGSVDIIRVPLVARGSHFFRLAINYVSFVFFGIFGSLFRIPKNIDVIFCFGVSPVTLCLPAIFYKYILRKPLVFWVQDLWPESISAVGAIQSQKLLNVVGKLVRFIYKRCDLILTQSEAFIPSILQWGADKKRVHYIPNWADPFKENSNQPEWISQLPKGFRVAFAGNIGKAQDVPTILAAAEILKKDSEIKWILAGDGSEKKWLDEEIIKRNLQENVYTVGKKNYDDMLPFFKNSDALLVTLTDQYIFSLTVPSKVQAYMSAGQPIIASLAGEGARIVKKANCGVSCSPQSAEKLAEAVVEMKNYSQEKRAQLGKNGYQFFLNNYKRDLVIDQIEIFFKNLIKN